jgi:hypothetical protein
VFGRAIRQQHAETIAVQPPDLVADAHAGIKPAADLDQHRIGRRDADRRVDRAHVIDADREEHRMAGRAIVGGDHAVDRLAQAGAVEVTGQLVVAGELLDPALLGLAVGDRADHAEHLLRPAGGVAQRAAALMHPSETAVGIAQPIFAVELVVPIEVSREHRLAMIAVVGMYMADEQAASGDPSGKAGAATRQATGPLDRVALQLPGIGEVAGRIERGGQKFYGLRTVSRHRHSTRPDVAVDERRRSSYGPSGL